MVLDISKKMQRIVISRNMVKIVFEQKFGSKSQFDFLRFRTNFFLDAVTLTPVDSSRAWRTRTANTSLQPRLAMLLDWKGTSTGSAPVRVGEPRNFPFFSPLRSSKSTFCHRIQWTSDTWPRNLDTSKVLMPNNPLQDPAQTTWTMTIIRSQFRKLRLPTRRMFRKFYGGIEPWNDEDYKERCLLFHVDRTKKRDLLFKSSKARHPTIWPESAIRSLFGVWVVWVPRLASRVRNPFLPYGDIFKRFKFTLFQGKETSS